MRRRHDGPHTLLVASGLVGGGAERRLRYLAEHLFGGHVDVLTLLEGPTRLPRSQGRIGSLGWEGDRSYPRVALALRRHLAREKYDLVMGFGLYTNLLVWCATWGRGPRPRRLMSEINRPRVVLADTARGGKRALLMRLLRMAYPRADVMAANSIDGAEECIRFFGVDRRKTVRVPNILDAAEVRARAREDLSVAWPSQRHTIIVCARLSRIQKRLDTVIRSLAALGPGRDCALMLVGDGPTRGDLQRLAVELGVDDRVYFYGWQENPLPLLARATVSVLSSEYEGFSNSVLEALFLDVPVITSYCSSDAREMCARGAAAGCEPGDVEGLTAALTQVLASAEKRAQMVRAAASYRSPHEISIALPLYEELMRAAAAGAALPSELCDFHLRGTWGAHAPLAAVRSAS
jgi:glycosyltransferase involved in cell wall biosynthesis